VQRARSIAHANAAFKTAQADDARRALECEKAEACRKRAAKRVASERRAALAAKEKEEHARALLEKEKEAKRMASRQYANSAVRRVKSERAHREAEAQRVLAGIAELQEERRKAGEAKGKELQQRCEDSDWSSARAMVYDALNKRLRGPGGVVFGSGGASESSTASTRLSGAAPCGSKRTSSNASSQPPGSAEPVVQAPMQRSLPSISKAKRPAAATAAGDLRLPPLPLSAR